MTNNAGFSIPFLPGNINEVVCLHVGSKKWETKKIDHLKVR